MAIDRDIDKKHDLETHSGFMFMIALTPFPKDRLKFGIGGHDSLGFLIEFRPSGQSNNNHHELRTIDLGLAGFLDTAHPNYCLAIPNKHLPRTLVVLYLTLSSWR